MEKAPVNSLMDEIREELNAVEPVEDIEPELSPDKSTEG